MLAATVIRRTSISTTTASRPTSITPCTAACSRTAQLHTSASPRRNSSRLYRQPFVVPQTSAHHRRTMSVAPLAEFDPAIHVLAVYGSLRDDDDSGQAWTTEFISGLGGARDGVVEGATIYWDLDAGYPKVILDRARNDTEADAAASTDSEAATSSPAAPTTPDFVHVRLLSWPSRAAFEAKMRAADLIEGFNPADESGSEYVRRAVWVRCVDPQTGKVERIRSWIYVMVETMTPHEKWVRIPAQDWMKRDRALKR